MNIRGISWAILLLMCAGVGMAQRAEEVKSLILDKVISNSRCPEDAGVIDLVDFDGQSNTFAFPGPIYLCYQDKFSIEQQGPSDVTCNDPNTATFPGVGYAFYKCEPNLGITGPAISNVVADACLEDQPAPSAVNGFYTYRDKINGDALFFNEGQIQSFFNSGDPESMWFAPITLDDFAENVVVENTGSSVNVRPDQAFEVIYLNEVVISNKQTNVGGNPLAGSFQVSGGVSEWDGTSYADIGIYKSGDIGVRGTIIGSGFVHDDVVNFTVPEEGEYVIYIEDEKSCGTSMPVNFTDMEGSVTFNIGSFTDIQGGSNCVSFCVEDFIDINAMQFTINFDPNYLTFDALTNFNLLFLSEGSFETSSAENGIIRVTWIDLNTTGQTITDGGCIFDVCFDVKSDAPLGGCSDIAISGNVVPVAIEQQDPDNVSNTFALDLIQNAGEVCVDPGSDLTVLTGTCNSAIGTFSGSITFEIFGGTGPYSYELIGALLQPVDGTGIIAGQSVEVFNLTGGSFILRITDASGTTIDQPVNIGNGNPLALDLTGSNPSCFNFSNGNVVSSVTGGATFPDGSYMYEWSNSIFNSVDIDRLNQGNYSLTVTDANGCQVIGNEFVGTDPINVVLDVTTMPTCITSSNGIGTATITGGTPNSSGNYNVKWEGDIMPTAFDVGSIVTSTQIQGGRLSVEVTDDNGCIWEEFFDVEPEKELDLRFDYDQEVLCAGDSEAMFRVFGEFSDGETFELDGLNTTVEPTGTTKLNGPDHIFFPSLGEGTYSITLTDRNNGCEADTTFTIEEPELLVINAAAIFSCTSSTGGEINLDVSGGTLDYSFLWSDGETIEDRANLDEGEYAVTVTDMNGCQDSFDVELMMGASASIDAIIIENIGCEGNITGGLMPVVTGAVGTVEYNWDGPGGPYNMADLSNLGPGTYYLTITDDMGCISVDSATLVEGQDFTYMVNQTAPSCTNSPDGTLAIAVNEPGTYEYVWAHPNNTGSEVLVNIPAGDYIVTITQVGGCSQLDTITLESPAGIDIQIQNSSPTLCSYSSDGSVSVIASGGVVDNGNYGFFWSSGENEPISANTTSTATMLASGQQYVVVVDEMCFDTLFFEVLAPDSLALDAANTVQQDVTCFGTDDGSATIAAMGGSPNYLFFWPDRNIMTAEVTGLPAGFHRYVLADANGCITLDSVLITQPDSLIAEIDQARTIEIGCSNDNNGVVAISVQGGDLTSSYNYMWDDDISSTDIANGLSPGAYSVTVTDSNGCIDSTSYELMAPLPISADIPTPEEPVCFGDRTCIGIDMVNGGSGSGYRFSINNGPLFPIDSCVRVFAGVYEMSIFDNTGCSFDTTLTIEQPEELILNLGPDIQVDLGDSSTIVDIAIVGPNPILAIDWDPNTDFGCLNDDCSRIAIFPNATTLYMVNVMDERGCTAEDELLVEVVRIVRVFFPNVFSPNGDGFNDLFNAFTGRGIQSIDEFSVFDRWGNQMYGIRNLPPNSGGTEGWDGRVNGVEVDSGVYTYYARVTLIDSEQVMVRGDVTLMR